MCWIQYGVEMGMGEIVDCGGVEGAVGGEEAWIVLEYIRMYSFEVPMRPHTRVVAMSRAPRGDARCMADHWCILSHGQAQGHGIGWMGSTGSVHSLVRQQTAAGEQARAVRRSDAPTTHARRHGQPGTGTGKGATVTTDDGRRVVEATNPSTNQPS